MIDKKRLANFGILLVVIVSLGFVIKTYVSRRNETIETEKSILNYKLNETRKRDAALILEKDSTILFNNKVILDLKYSNYILIKKQKNEIDKLRSQKEYLQFASDSALSSINDSILRANGYK